MREQIIKEEINNVGMDYGWCNCCSQGIDSRENICESCLEFSKNLLKRQKEKILEIMDDWLNEYCTHGKDVCRECIEELKQRIKGKKK